MLGKSNKFLFYELEIILKEVVLFPYFRSNSRFALMLNLYRGRIEFCDIESPIRSALEQQTGILQMTLLRTPVV